MNAIACQLDIAWEDKAANFRRTRSLLKDAAVPPGSLFVLPELFSTGFSMNVRELAEGADSPTERFLAELALEHRIYVIGGAIRKGERAARNESVAFSPEGRLLARYAKLQPFTLGTEAQHYEAGRRLGIFDCGGLKTALFICYDLRFPELFRAAVQQGAQLFVVIANWPVVRIHHWVTLLQARAIENQAYVIGVNRTGQDPKLLYPGRSLIVDPHGAIMADAGEKERLISAELDPEKVTEWRQQFPALADIRAEFKSPVL